MQQGVECAYHASSVQSEEEILGILHKKMNMSVQVCVRPQLPPVAFRMPPPSQ